MQHPDLYLVWFNAKFIKRESCLINKTICGSKSLSHSNYLRTLYVAQMLRPKNYMQLIYILEMLLNKSTESDYVQI